MAIVAKRVWLSPADDEGEANLDADRRAVGIGRGEERLLHLGELGVGVDVEVGRTGQVVGIEQGLHIEVRLDPRVESRAATSCGCGCGRNRAREAAGECVGIISEAYEVRRRQR